MKRWLIVFTDEEGELLDEEKNGDNQHDFILKMVKERREQRGEQ